MFAFNVWLENKLIDTVFYQVSKRQTVADALDDVKRAWEKREAKKAARAAA